jgi:hypothetical protein
VTPVKFEMKKYGFQLPRSAMTGPLIGCANTMSSMYRVTSCATFGGTLATSFPVGPWDCVDDRR